MKSKQKFFFQIVCSLNILFLFAVIVDFLLPISRPLQSGLVLIVNLLYIISYNKPTKNVQTPFFCCYVLYCFLLITQMLVSLINDYDTSTFFLATSLLLISLSFWRVLKITSCQINSLDDILSPYLLINYFTVIASFLVFVLLLIGVISVEQFLVNPSKYELLYGNYVVAGSSVSNPLHLIIVILTDRGIKFFGQFGVFCGICHEPHLSTLLLMPSLFFMLAKSKNKTLLLLLFIINVFLAGSVTNMLIIAFCLSLYLIFCNNLSNKSTNYFKFIFTGIIIYCIIYYQSIVDTFGLEIINSKLQVGNASYDASNQILSYLYNPKTILGSGILIYSQNVKATDIGLVSFILNFILLVSFVFGIIKLFLTRKKECMIMSIGLVYFFLHMQKIGQMIYQFPYLLFILFVGHLIYIKYVYAK